MEHVYCPKCGCNRLSVDCLAPVLLDFTDAAEPQMQQFDGWNYHGDDPHVECDKCRNEGRLSEFTHNKPFAFAGATERIDNIIAAATRLLVGVTGKSAPACEWYEGITEDAADELRKALGLPHD